MKILFFRVLSIVNGRKLKRQQCILCVYCGGEIARFCAKKFRPVCEKGTEVYLSYNTIAYTYKNIIN